MNSLPICPESKQLRQFVDVDSSTPLSDEMLRHFAECAACSAVISEALKNDPLTLRILDAGWPPAKTSLEDESLSQRIAEAVETQLNAIDNTIRIFPPRLELGIDLSWLKPAEAPDEIGRLGDFRVLRLLGQGGMGAVFEAQDTRLQRRVALKVMLPELSTDRAAADRFLHEARSAAAVHHQHVVTIFEVGKCGPVPYLAMELLKGESLEARIAGGKSLSPKEASHIASHIAEGLAAAHRQGVLHRDIKPANIWLEFDAPTHKSVPHVKLLDFGLAKSMLEQYGLTQSGIVIGTLRYLSPEQARGEKLDARSDLFSLGCVLYRMLSGQLPFRGRDALGQLNALANENPIQLDRVVSELPVGLAELTHRLLAREAAQRPSSAAEVASQLRLIAEVPHSAEAKSSSDLKAPLNSEANAGGRRNRYNGWLWLSVGLLPAAILLGVIWITLRDRNGNETKIQIQAPEGTRLLSVEESLTSSSDQDASAKTDRIAIPPSEDVKAEALHEEKPVAMGAKHIDHSERFAWQPKELVAVIGQHRDRHWSAVGLIRFHPSGEFFLTIPTTDNAVARVTSTLEPLDGAIEASAARGVLSTFGAEFSEDGRRLVSANQVFAIDRTDTAHPKMTLEQTLPTDGNRFGSSGVAIHDNRWMMLGVNEPNGLEVWDVSLKPAKLVKQIASESMGDRMSLSADGRKFVTNGAAGIQVWDIDWTDSTNPIFVHHNAEVAGVSFALSADGSRLAAGGEGISKIEIWDVSRTPFSLQQSVEGGRAFAFSPDGNKLAIAAGLGFQIYAFEENVWVNRFKLSEGMSAVTSLAWSPTRDNLVAGDQHGGVHVWDAAANPPVRRNPTHAASNAVRLAIALDGRSALVQGTDHLAAQWSLEGTSPSRTEFTTHSTDFAPQFSNDSKLALLNGNVWNLALQPPSMISDAFSIVTRFSPYRNRLVTQSEGRLVEYAWELTKRGRFSLTKEQSVWSLPKSQGMNDEAIATLSWQTMRFAVVQDDQTIGVWSLSSPEKPLYELKHNLSWGNSTKRLTLAEGGNLLLAFSQRESIVWDLDESPPREYRIQLDPYFQDAMFSADDRILLVADGDGVGFYDWSNNREVYRLSYPGVVRQIVMHPDGKHFATVNGNGTVYLLRNPPLPISRR